jgi:hypothetical protein
MGMKLPADKRLDEIFGISEEIADTLPSTIIEAETVHPEPESDPDSEEAVELLKRLAIKGEDLLDELTLVAKSSEKARDYEVAAGLIRSLSDVAKSIIEEKRKDKMLSAPVEPQTVTNNTLVVQSTEDLIRMIHQQTKNG